MPLATENIAKYKPILLAIIPDNGAAIGNKTLRSKFKEAVKAKDKLKLTDDDYWMIRNALLTDGIIRTGRGYGGSVARVISETVLSKQPKEQLKYQDEDSLYTPMHDTIKRSWVKNDQIENFVSKITARQGRRDTGGRWTRPDITLVAVRLYPFIPGKSIEVITFEIKPWNYLGVEGVFETASHSAFAHRSYLMIHAAKSIYELPAYERIERECVRFGVGLITCEDPADWETYDTRLDAVHHVPDSHNDVRIHQ